jgi:hypothetical protein
MIEIHVEREEIKRDIQANTFDVMGGTSTSHFSSLASTGFQIVLQKP